MGQQFKKAPVYFIGHGSPMNALQQNAYTKSVAAMRALYPSPRAILVISAHWETRGTFVTAMPRPKTIHDFGGFPKELFAVKYPAPGSPEVAELIKNRISSPSIQLDESDWGLDHGTWAVLRHIFPEATIPVLQLSLDMTQPVEFHLELGKQLAQLRDQGVLIVGSGNLVHNLRRISWEPNAAVMPWAEEFDAWTKQKIESRDSKALVNDFHSTEAGRLSVPTLDHYLPLLYVLGAAGPKDELRFTNEEIQNGSIAMRSLVLG